jgi:signal transduction histidine kinase
MNRLWVRISVTLALIIFFLVIVPLAVDIAYSDFSPPADEFANNHDEEYYSPIEEEPDLFPGDWLILELAWPMTIVLVVSVVAGALLSRTLVAPLSDLSEAAAAIGAHDLSQRVEAKGSRELKELASAFNKMASDLEQAESLRSNLLADVAHELRTPLSVVQGNLRAILDDVYRLDKKEIARLYDQTRHLSGLVEDLRELAQAEANQLHLDMEPVDLKGLVQEVSEAFAPAADEGKLTLRIELADELPQVLADRLRMTQILHNLLDNALRHTDEGGEVIVSLAKADGGVELSVTDDGEGISAADQARIFDRFYRGDDARGRDAGNTGLGLAIVEAQTGAMGGRVDVYSAGLGKGSRFRIWLPGR